jgi:hypothetical protein
MAVITKIILKLAFATMAMKAVMASPLNSAESGVVARHTLMARAEEDDSIALNGCYKNGPTFAEAGFQDGSFIGGPCALLFQGFYNDGGIKRTCINGNPGDSVTLSVQRFGGSGSGTLNEQE